MTQVFTRALLIKLSKRRTIKNKDTNNADVKRKQFLSVRQVFEFIRNCISMINRYNLC